MGVLGVAMADIFADEDVTVAASYRRPPYPWQSIRVIMSSPVDIDGLTVAGTRQADILTADVRDEPGPDDELRIDGVTYTVRSAEGDELGLSWRVRLSSPAED